MFKNFQLPVRGSTITLASAIVLAIGTTALAWPANRNSGAGSSIRGSSTASITPTGSYSNNNTNTRNVGTGNLSTDNQSDQTSTPIGVKAASTTKTTNGGLSANLTTGAAAGQNPATFSGTATGSTSGGVGEVSTRAAGNASPKGSSGLGQGSVRVRK